MKIITLEHLLQVLHQIRCFTNLILFLYEKKNFNQTLTDLPHFYRKKLYL
jgi:hypothetical protein